jgi:hypothetical protein
MEAEASAGVVVVGGEPVGQELEGGDELDGVEFAQGDDHRDPL